MILEIYVIWSRIHPYKYWHKSVIMIILIYSRYLHKLMLLTIYSQVVNHFPDNIYSGSKYLIERNNNKYSEFKLERSIYVCIFGTHNKGKSANITTNHRGELPVFYYHKIMVMYPYPFVVLITLLLSWIIFINDFICIWTDSPG